MVQGVGSGVATAALDQIPLFSGLATDERQALGSRLRRRRIARGEVVFVKGEPGSYLYILESGAVKITLTSADGKEMILALLGPGDFFGELALLDGEPRSADAVALEASQALLLQREEFLAYLEERPRVAVRLLGVLSRRLRQSDELVQDAAFFDIPARLASALLRLADTLGHPTQAGVTLSRRLTQAELAGMIGATRESVNKWLGFYEKQGFLHIERGIITLKHPEGLRRRVY